MVGAQLHNSHIDYIALPTAFTCTAIPTASSQVHGSPADCNVLPEIRGDPRTAHKLFDAAANVSGGCREDAEGPWAPPPRARKALSDTWLAPRATRDGNELWLCFEHPVGLTLLRVLNYSKDPARGVHEVPHVERTPDHTPSPRIDSS